MTDNLAEGHREYRKRKAREAALGAPSLPVAYNPDAPLSQVPDGPTPVISVRAALAATSTTRSRNDPSPAAS